MTKQGEGREPKKSDNISYADRIEEIIHHLKSKKETLTEHYKQGHLNMSHGNFLKIRHHLNLLIKYYKKLKKESEKDLDEIDKKYLDECKDIRVMSEGAMGIQKKENV